MAQAAAVPASPILGDTALEEGKALYDNGQYQMAMDKFFIVLRRDPRNPEARRYVSLVVDQIRNKRRDNPGRPKNLRKAFPGKS